MTQLKMNFSKVLTLHQVKLFSMIAEKLLIKLSPTMSKSTRFTKRIVWRINMKKLRKKVLNNTKIKTFNSNSNSWRTPRLTMASWSQTSLLNRSWFQKSGLKHQSKRINSPFKYKNRYNSSKVNSKCYSKRSSNRPINCQDSQIRASTSTNRLFRPNKGHHRWQASSSKGHNRILPFSTCLAKIISLLKIISFSTPMAIAVVLSSLRAMRGFKTKINWSRTFKSKSSFLTASSLKLANTHPTGGVSPNCLWGLPNSSSNSSRSSKLHATRITIMTRAANYSNCRDKLILRWTALEIIFKGSLILSKNLESHLRGKMSWL